MTLGIGAIFKDEAPYILEWVAFHQLVGFTRFFIADNDSTDGTSELLDRLARSGVVTRLPFPTGDRAPQLPAYREILSRYGGTCDWLAFIDADEFVVPTGGVALADHLAAIGRSDVGAVVLNWAVYGSSGLVEADDRPVLERFTWLAAETQRISRTFKSIVRPGAVSDFPNPHEATLKEGFRAIMANGKPLVPWKRPGHSTRVVREPFRLNHYVVKSHAEWLMKRDRGNVGILGARRPKKFFAEKDFADREEPFDTTLLAAMLERRRALESLIA